MQSYAAKGVPPMRKLVALSVLTLACVSLLWMPKARTAANDEAQIRQLIDRWAKAFRAKDLNAIMSIYQPGQALVAFDLVPPLQYLGSDAYKKDYQDFLAQYQGAIDVEIRDHYGRRRSEERRVGKEERCGGG